MHRWIAILLLPMIACNQPAGQPVSVPRHAMAVTCFIGGIDSGRSCSGQMNKQELDAPNLSIRPSVRCGDTGGKISEVEWQFLGQRGGSDLYRLTRRFPADDPAPKVTTKEIEFSGERIIVFQDETHCIVAERPRK